MEVYLTHATILFLRNVRQQRGGYTFLVAVIISQAPKILMQNFTQDYKMIQNHFGVNIINLLIISMIQCFKENNITQGRISFDCERIVKGAFFWVLLLNNGFHIPVHPWHYLLSTDKSQGMKPRDASFRGVIHYITTSYDNDYD
ncbi:hypothetical protein ACJX0J_005953, partial [Zea mays]